MQWNNDWYCNPIKEDDYLDMATYIYNNYDRNVVRQMPDGSLNKLKLFIEDGDCSDFSYTQFLMRSGIMANPEIGRRIYHWLTCDVV